MALMQINFFSKCLMRTVTVQAVIPLGKFSPPDMPLRQKKPFKTLYLLHGIFGNYTDWVSGTRIQAWAEERDLAVIMPSGENRFYVDNELTGDLYGEFIGKELVSFTRELLPLSHRREDTFIAGLSMGGYGAIRNGLKYHDTFGWIAGLSSAFIIDNIVKSTDDAPLPTRRRSYYQAIFGDIKKIRESDKDPKALIKSIKMKGEEVPEMYLCCGTEDFLIEQNRDYHRFLRRNKIKHTYEEGPGTHNWEFWDTYIKRVLDWLPMDTVKNKNCSNPENHGEKTHD